MLLFPLALVLIGASVVALVVCLTGISVRSKRVGAIVVSLAVLSATAPAGAQDRTDEQLVLQQQGLLQLDDVEAGVLLFESDEPGWYVPAPTLHTDIDVTVSGPIARVTVSQRFRNVADIFVEGKYVFPLPEGSAVDTLRMRVGDRWIEGSIAEREEARLVYEEAKAAGQVASLVEQERPNVFTTSVANIAPNSDVVVQIEYQEALVSRDGRFGMRLPLVVAPRYVPVEQRTEILDLTSQGWVLKSEIDDEAARVTGPVADPRAETDGALRNPVDISIDLNAGFSLGAVDSPYHDVDVILGPNEHAAFVELLGPVPADRDFYLSWAPADLSDPVSATFTEQHQGERHFITMLTPPTTDEVVEDTRPREVIFVQDTSGSMGGESLKQAKAGLTMGLQRLSEDDVFNIIEFNTYFSSFSSAPVPATQRNIERAVAWVDDLVATNGTQMEEPLKAALADSTPNDGRLRQVIFLTDGAVSNEVQMLELIERDLAKSRLFTVGIGSAPNSYFMTAAATSGRGASVFIGDLGEVNQQMQTLFAKIETPAVVDLAVQGLPVDVSVSPFPIPDLYVGDPIVLTVRVPDGIDTDMFELVGTRGDDDWAMEIYLDQAQERPGVSKLWAREHIRNLEALRVSPLLTQEQREVVDDSVLQTALEFGMVSRLTSLVAVDVEVTRPADAPSTSTDIARNLPDGWDPDIFFDGASSDDADLSDELLARLEAADDVRARQAQGSVPFAATGGDWQVQALAGGVLTIAGALAFVAVGRRRDDDV